jgi:hypothetical protein
LVAAFRGGPIEGEEHGEGDEEQAQAGRSTDIAAEVGAEGGEAGVAHYRAEQRLVSGDGRLACGGVHGGGERARRAHPKVNE